MTLLDPESVVSKADVLSRLASRLAMGLDSDSPREQLGYEGQGQDENARPIWLVENKSASASLISVRARPRWALISLLRSPTLLTTRSSFTSTMASRQGDRAPKVKNRAAAAVQVRPRFFGCRCRSALKGTRELIPASRLHPSACLHRILPV